MKCPSCGYVSLEPTAACPGCGAERAPGARPPATGKELASLRLGPETAPVAPPLPRSRRRATGRPARRTAAPPAADEVLELDEGELEQLSLPREATPAPAGDQGDFRISDDLLAPAPAAERARPRGADFTWGAAGELEPRPPQAGAGGLLFSLDGPEPGDAADEDGAPIIDSDEEIPERYWASEGARLGRRAVALAVDLLLLGALVALFYAGAYAALRLSGVPAARLLSPAGLAAAAAPLGLLGLLAGFLLHVSCNTRGGRTPGRRLLGLEVRGLDGKPPSLPAAVSRWFAALLGTGFLGVGVVWALFEPRRRGWADLLSGTVVAERRHGRGGDAADVTDDPRR